jgi:hypothetical protein
MGMGRLGWVASGRQPFGGLSMRTFATCTLRCTLAAAMVAAACGLAAAGESPLARTGGAVPGKNVEEKNPPEKPAQDGPARDKNNDDGLVIEPQDVPPTYPHGSYQVNFHARGNYVPTLHWSVGSGALPPGIRLEDTGELHGEAERTGEFEFVVVVRDGGKPQQAIQHGFTIKVTEAITVNWKVPAHVNSNRIEGSVEVSNTTVDDVDLTFDVKAVAENGRATEIGYQHFPLKRGTVAMALPFGETLPHGGYTVYVNVVGEVAKRNAIYREGLQAPGTLQVVVGP